VNDTAEVPAPIVPLLLLLLVILVLLEHLRAWFAPASFEHLSQIVQQLAVVDGGRGPLDGRGLVTGGGGLVLWLHWLVREMGLPYAAMHGLYAALDLATVLAWVAVARRWLSAPMLWGSALALAMYEVPKFYLVENSTLMAFTAPVLLACLLTAVRRDSLAWMAAAAALMALSTHLGLLALFAVPAALVVVWRGGFTRWKTATALLVAAAVVPILPIWSAAEAHNPVAEEFLFRLQPARLGGTLLGIAGYLGSYLGEAFLLLGLVAVVLAPRSLRAAASHLGLGAVWLAVTAVPAAILDPFEEPYHFAMASPGRALLAGFGVMALGAAIRRVSGERLGWTGAVACLLVACCAGSALTTAWAAAHPQRLVEDADSDTSCASWDQGCHRKATDLLLADLEAAGLLPAPDQPVSFHGVSQHCLDAAWYWRRSQLVDDPSLHRASPLHILLMAADEDPDLASHTGGMTVGALVAVTGVEPVEWFDDWDLQPDPPYTFEVPSAGRDLLYVGVETSRPFDAGGVLASRGAAGTTPLARCDNRRDEGPDLQYDGFYVFDAGAVPGDDPLRVTIHSAVDEAFPPENVDLLRLPPPGAPR
jgi:hypothetical protein